MKELSKALCKFQSAITNVPFDSQNPHFKNKYASLAGIIDHVRTGLSDNGLVISQLVNKDSVQTMLIHTSGESLSAETAILCATPNNPQAYGSAVTYARRYALTGILGISADDDDDAAQATGSPQKPSSNTTTPPTTKTPPEPAPASPQMATEAQRRKIDSLRSECGWSPEDTTAEIVLTYKVKSSKEMTLPQAKDLIDRLEKIKADKAKIAAADADFGALGTEVKEEGK